MGTIHPIVMPKWGLAMLEGMLAQWDVAEGDTLDTGQEIADIETAKIANVFESPVSGTLRRIVVSDGDTVPVGALLAVVTEGDVDDGEIDAFVAKFLEEFVPPEEGDEDGPEPEFAQIGDGRQIRYLKADAADGSSGATPLIAIHGFGSDHTSWMFNQTELAADRPVYAVDLAGHGGSTKDVGEGSVDTLADDILSFLEALGIKSAHFVGHSLGGAVAVAAASKNPAACASLSLIAPAGMGTEINIGFIEDFISLKRARKLRTALQALVANPDFITNDMTEQVLRFKRLDGASEALTKLAGAVFAGGTQQRELRSELEALGVPRLVIWGADDQILPSSHADGLDGAVTIRVLENCGHLPHMEDAASVNEAVAGLVSGS